MKQMAEDRENALHEVKTAMSKIIRLENALNIKDEEYDKICKCPNICCILQYLFLFNECKLTITKQKVIQMRKMQTEVDRANNNYEEVNYLTPFYTFFEVIAYYMQFGFGYRYRNPT
jgi:hypothetical protein